MAAQLGERHESWRPAAGATPFLSSGTGSPVWIKFLHLQMSRLQSVAREVMGFEIHLLAAVLL